MCWQVFSNKYIYNRLSELEYIVLWTWCVILVITIANSRPGAPMNSNVAIVGSRWRHNCCHWIWVKEPHTDKATTRYETYVMTYVATQSSLDDFPLWTRLDLDLDRVSSETRSGSKPSLESSLKSRLLVNIAPGLYCRLGGQPHTYGDHHTHRMMAQHGETSLLDSGLGTTELSARMWCQSILNAETLGSEIHYNQIINTIMNYKPEWFCTPIYTPLCKSAWTLYEPTYHAPWKSCPLQHDMYPFIA